MDKDNQKFTKSNQSCDLNSETLKKILDNSYDEIFVLDRNGVVLYVNSACERHYGLKAKDFIGKEARELVEKGYFFPWLIPEVLEKRKRIHVEQTTGIGKKLLVTATPVFNEEGEIELIVENSRDITQLEAFRQDLENAKELVKRYKGEVEELRKRELNIFGLVAHSEKMKAILELSQHVALADSYVLLLGESGTGKGVLARFIHKESNRKAGPFITINCAAIPDNLLESELFGYSPGAFTGASKRGKIGLVELANEGTLFLDEIADIPLRLQAKLLQVIQDRQFMPIGGREAKKVDVRIIAATNRDLHQMVKDKVFRDDLYYRLSVIEIIIPPLRERYEDIMPLIYLFLNRFDNHYETHHQISAKALDLLTGYSWPGNVRELENLIERLVVTVQETTITPEHLPSSIYELSNQISKKEIFNNLMPLDEAVGEATKQLVIKAYKQLGSSYKVADALKISQSKASRLIRRFANRNNRNI